MSNSLNGEMAEVMPKANMSKVPHWEEEKMFVGTGTKMIDADKVPHSPDFTLRIKWKPGMRVMGVRVNYKPFMAKGKETTLFPGVLLYNLTPWLGQHRSDSGRSLYHEYYVLCDADGRIRKFYRLRAA